MGGNICQSNRLRFIALPRIKFIANTTNGLDTVLSFPKFFSERHNLDIDRAISHRKIAIMDGADNLIPRKNPPWLLRQKVQDLEL